MQPSPQKKMILPGLRPCGINRRDRLCWYRQAGSVGCDAPRQGCVLRSCESRQVCSGCPTCPTCPTRPPRPTRQLARLDAPRQGCSVLSPDVEGRKPRRRPRDSSVGKFPSTPPGRRTDCLTGKCDTLSGSYLFMMVNRFPGSSALRASTTGLKAGDPSGAPPLRDRTAPLRGCSFHRHRSSAKR